MRTPPCINDADIAVFARSLREARRIGIATHTRPDGDAVGSCLAMRRFILAARPDIGGCRIMSDTPLPSSITFLLDRQEREELLVYASDKAAVCDFAQSCDLLIFLDLGCIGRCGAMAEAFEGSKAKKILVDHHLNPDRDAFDTVFSTTGISSTCELLYHVLLKLEPCLSPVPAVCMDPLLAGITTDTNNFANSVFPTTFETVSALIDKGADRETILQHLYNEYPERRVRMMGYLLDNCLTITAKGVAVMVLDEETIRRFGCEEGDTEGFVNIPLSAANVKMSIFLKQASDEYRVSIRSKKGWSAQRLALKYYEGGGHEQASGGRIPFSDTPPTREEITAAVIRQTNEFLEDE